MQVPPIHHRLNDVFNYLLNQNASFRSHLQPSSIAYLLCKWSAIVLALLATFRTIILAVRFPENSTSPPSVPLYISDDDYSDTDDDEVSSTSSEFEDEDNEDQEEDRSGEYFRLRGSGDGDGDGGGFVRCRSISDFLSLSEIANSKSVVKLWDTIGFGLGFGFDNSDSSSDGSVVNVYEEDKVRPVPTGKPPTPIISCASPVVVVSAGESASGNLALKIWDTRLRRRIPAVIAEWGPNLGKTFGVEFGGVHKIYVRDDGRYGLTVGDIRNVTEF